MILMASLTDFHFSHRVWFYVNSEMMETRNVVLAAQVIKGLKNISMHEDNAEVLFLANSKDFIKLIVDLEMIKLYPAIKKVLFSDLVY